MCLNWWSHTLQLKFANDLACLLLYISPHSSSCSLEQVSQVLRLHSGGPIPGKQRLHVKHISYPRVNRHSRSTVLPLVTLNSEALKSLPWGIALEGVCNNYSSGILYPPLCCSSSGTLDCVSTSMDDLPQLQTWCIFHISCLNWSCVTTHICHNPCACTVEDLSSPYWACVAEQVYHIFSVWSLDMHPKIKTQCSRKHVAQLLSLHSSSSSFFY